jgi:alkylation response protein AidB-like acyl-CoA dehydrogenase
MTLRLSDEQRDLRDAVRVLADERIAPRAAAIDASAEFPWDVVELLAQHDVLALPYPVEHGGLGVDLLSVCLAIEQVSRACATSGLIVAVQSLGSLPLLLAARAAGTVVPDLAAGAGSLRPDRVGIGLGRRRCPDDRAPRRRRLADRRSQALHQPGQRRTRGRGLRGHRSRPDAPPSALTCYMVERGPFDRPRRAQDGHPGLADRRAPLRRPGADANRVGEVRDGFAIAMRTLDRSRPGIAAQACGIAQGALEAAARYAAERRQFGRPIGEHQMVAAMLADMAARTEAARQLLYTACIEIDAGSPQAGRWSAMCKLVAGDTAMAVTTDAVQVFGGYGYISEYPVERMMRDAKITQLYEGTQQIQRLVIGRDVLAHGG